MSDSRRTTVSHLGRAVAEAYRSEDECDGGLGAEVGALAWLAVSSGASLAMALRRSCYGCGARERRKKRREERGDRVEPGGAERRPDQVIAGRPRRVHDADVRPPRGQRRVDEGGRPRVGERGGGAGPCGFAGPKGRRVDLAASIPFFLKFLFSKKFK